MRKHIRLRLNGPAFDGTYCPLRRSANTRTWPAGVRARFPPPWKVGPPHDLTRDDSRLSVRLYTVEIAACLCFYSGGIVITARIVIICVRYYWKVCREHGVEFSSLDDIHEDTKSLNVVFMGLVLDVI